MGSGGAEAGRDGRAEAGPGLPHSSAAAAPGPVSRPRVSRCRCVSFGDPVTACPALSSPVGSRAVFPGACHFPKFLTLSLGRHGLRGSLGFVPVPAVQVGRGRGGGCPRPGCRPRLCCPQASSHGSALAAVRAQQRTCLCRDEEGVGEGTTWQRPRWPSGPTYHLALPESLLASAQCPTLDAQVTNFSLLFVLMWPFRDANAPPVTAADA